MPQSYFASTLWHANAPGAHHLGNTDNKGQGSHELTHRPVTADDVKTLCGFPQGVQELYFMFPKAQYPLTKEQMHTAISQRFDSTAFLANGEFVGFANFYRAEHGGVCCIGNVIVAPYARGQGVARYIVETMTAVGFESIRPGKCSCPASTKTPQGCCSTRNSASCRSPSKNARHLAADAQP
ncbi:GNAT family protein [Pseudomonas parakoreensis]